MKRTTRLLTTNIQISISLKLNRLTRYALNLNSNRTNHCLKSDYSLFNNKLTLNMSSNLNYQFIKLDNFIP